MQYTSTRGGRERLRFKQALFSSYAQDGGLLIPNKLPTISVDILLQWKSYSFAEICAEILHLYSGIALTALNEMTKAAYAGFNPEGQDALPLPIERVGGLLLLNASLGPTLAFKDIGMQMIARLMEYYMKEEEKERESKGEKEEGMGRRARANIVVDTSGKDKGGQEPIACGLGNVSVQRKTEKERGRVNEGRFLQCQCQ